jgi:hypothetical protein
MAPDHSVAPNVYDAEPIPEAARAEIDRLLKSGDLFRYTAPEDAPVALLEREFADLMGTSNTRSPSPPARPRSSCRCARST